MTSFQCLKLLSGELARDVRWQNHCSSKGQAWDSKSDNVCSNTLPCPEFSQSGDWRNYGDVDSPELANLLGWKRHGSFRMVPQDDEGYCGCSVLMGWWSFHSGWWLLWVSEGPPVCNRSALSSNRSFRAPDSKRVWKGRTETSGT